MKKFLGLLGILLGMALTTMNYSILNTALYAIQKNLSASVLQLQWIVNIYGIFLASTILIMGRLGDSFGHKKVYCWGIVGIALGSLGAGLSSSSGWMIASQALIGFAGSGILPVAQVLIVREYAAKEKEHAVGIWAAGIGVMLGIGPLVAGLILHFLDWRWIFLINIPVAIISFLLVKIFIRKQEKSANHKTIDLKNSFMIFVFLATLVMGIMNSSELKLISPILIGNYILFFASAILLFLFYNRSKDPIISTSFFSNKNFMLVSAAIFCLNAFIWSIFFILPLYLHNVKNESAINTGILMLCVTGPVALFGPLIGKLCAMKGPKILLLIGFAFLILSSLFQLNFHSNSTALLIIVGALIFGLGWMFIYGSAASAALLSIPEEKSGEAAGLFATLLEVGGTVGLAITGTTFRLSATSAFLNKVPALDNASYKTYVKDYISDPYTLKTSIPANLYTESEFMSHFDDSFMKGFHDAIWILLLFSIIGMGIVLFVKSSGVGSFRRGRR